MACSKYTGCKGERFYEIQGVRKYKNNKRVDIKWWCNWFPSWEFTNSTEKLTNLMHPQKGWQQFWLGQGFNTFYLMPF
jgi:hypothetical protein